MQVKGGGDAGERGGRKGSLRLKGPQGQPKPMFLLRHREPLSKAQGAPSSNTITKAFSPSLLPRCKEPLPVQPLYANLSRQRH